MSQNRSAARRHISIAISFALILLFRLLPPPSGMTPAAMQVIGIFLGVFVLWMTVSIDWPSMLCVLAIALVPGLNMTSVLAGSVGNSTFSFLLFTFMCTYALGRTPFVSRCALAFVTSGAAKRSAWSFVTLYFASVLFLGSFMSPTVLVAVLITITEEIFAVLGLQKTGKVGSMMMGGMVFCTSIAAGMTTVAHVFPLISLGIYQTVTGSAISHAAYMAVGVPVGLLAFAAMLLLFRFVLRPDMSELRVPDVAALKQNLKPMDAREKATVAVFFLVVALWVLPGIIKPVWPQAASVLDGLGSAFPPLLGAVLMSVISLEGKPLLAFSEAMSKGIPWSSLIMVAGTLSLSLAITNKDIGLTAWVSERVAPVAQGFAPIMLALFFVLWALVQTNFSSSMVAATVVTTVALPIALSGAGASAAALTCLIGIAASFAFATPPGMPTVAFAIGTGWTTAGFMAKYGFLLMAAAWLLTALVGYPLATLLL